MPRVLVVDDSPTARELISEILKSNPDIEIVGHAKNGEEAVQLTQRLRPDVVTMDIHMPLLNGLGATRTIMSSCPTPIVIVSSSTRVHDVDWAMKALQSGALTLLLKPPGPESHEYERAARDLVQTVTAMAGVKVVRRRAVAAEPRQVTPPVVTRQVQTRVVAVAASTGGPPAILKALSDLPADFAAPVLVVQHIASGFTNGFVSWLDSGLRLRVKVADQNEALAGGVVYVAPEDRHLGCTSHGRVVLSDAPAIGGFRPSANFLFDSVGRAYKQAALGVILTGMGNDGVDGLRTIHEKDGHVIAQDEESCVVYGMPAAAKRAGVVGTTLPLNSICNAIIRSMQSHAH